MKSTWKFLSILAALFFCLALAGGAQAAPQAAPALPGETQQQCGPLVMGGACTLAEGESISSDMAVLGGSVTIEKGATVEGDLVVVGGAVYANGTVEGDLAAIGGSVFLDGTVEGSLQVVGGMASMGKEALVEGDIDTLAASLQQEDGARVEGEVRNAPVGPFSLVIPGRLWLPDWDIDQGEVPIPPVFDLGRATDVSTSPAFVLNPAWGVGWWLFRSFVWAGLALLASLLIPRHTVRAGEGAVARPVLAGGMGCLTVLVAPIVLVLLVITICGIPFAMIGAFLLAVAWAFGIIALGTEIGQRMARMSHQDWALPVSAALGTLALTLVTNGIGALVPCVGWMLPALVGIVGLGAVLVTRFGADVFPTNGASPAGFTPEPVEPLPPAPEPEPLAGPEAQAPSSPPVTQVIDEIP